MIFRRSSQRSSGHSSSFVSPSEPGPSFVSLAAQRDALVLARIQALFVRIRKRHPVPHREAPRVSCCLLLRSWWDYPTRRYTQSRHSQGWTYSEPGEFPVRFARKFDKLSVGAKSGNCTKTHLALRDRLRTASAAILANSAIRDGSLGRTDPANSPDCHRQLAKRRKQRLPDIPSSLCGQNW